MKVQILRNLITHLQSNVQLTFCSAIEKEFPSLLEKFNDDDELPLSILLKASDSLKLLNMYGVLFSLQGDYKLARNSDLLKNLEEVLTQIKKDFPGINTSATPNLKT